MGLGSGIQQVHDIHFKSPKTGGDRIAGVGYSWSAGGQMPDNEKLAVYWMYAYSDELTTDVLEMLSRQLDELAAETGREVLRHPRSSDGYDLEEIRAQVAVMPSHHRAYFYTGYGPLADRLGLDDA